MFLSSSSCALSFCNSFFCQYDKSSEHLDCDFVSTHLILDHLTNTMQLQGDQHLNNHASKTVSIIKNRSGAQGRIRVLGVSIVASMEFSPSRLCSLCSSTTSLLESLIPSPAVFTFSLNGSAWSSRCKNFLPSGPIGIDWAKKPRSPPRRKYEDWYWQSENFNATYSYPYFGPPMPMPWMPPYAHIDTYSSWDRYGTRAHSGNSFFALCTLNFFSSDLALWFLSIDCFTSLPFVANVNT